MTLIYGGFDPVAAVDAALAARAARQGEVTDQLSFDLRRPTRRKLSMEMARHIRRLRRDYGWTYRELGELAGVDPSTIRRVVKNVSYVERAA